MYLIGKTEFYFTHWGLPSAQQPSAAPRFALPAPEVLFFSVQCIASGWSAKGRAMHAGR